MQSFLKFSRNFLIKLSYLLINQFYGRYLVLIPKVNCISELQFYGLMSNFNNIVKSKLRKSYLRLFEERLIFLYQYFLYLKAFIKS